MQYFIDTMGIIIVLVSQSGERLKGYLPKVPQLVKNGSTTSSDSLTQLGIR